MDKVSDTTTASTTGPNMSTTTNPDEMPKEALEAEPDAGEQNQQVSYTDWGGGNLTPARYCSSGSIPLILNRSRVPTLRSVKMLGWPLCPPSHKLPISLNDRSLKPTQIHRREGVWSTRHKSDPDGEKNNRIKENEN